MRDSECIAFLQWALPKLGMRWEGFRKPRRQVCRRIKRRIEELGLEGFDGYRRRLAAEGAPSPEWLQLDSFCRVTISRFFRDRAVWEALGREVLPVLKRAARDESRTLIRAWSAGCASGEEPYSLRLLWEFGGEPSRADAALEVVATDSDERLLTRARRAVYSSGCLRELPERWRSEAFRETAAGEYELREGLRRGVTFRCEDVRDAAPPGPFDLASCRNLAWTYFDASVQRGVLERIVTVLRPGGFLLIGGHEVLPVGGKVLDRVGRSIFRRR